ncbi:MAG TPA: aminotransferase [Bacteroidales bacterium]|nr:aminotransferase [Bacteroidales bacterium]
MAINRRNFLRSSAVALAGSYLFKPDIQGSSKGNDSIETIGSADDEQWWKFLKSQFSLKEDLYYFNNGSLGPSPEYVIDKTEKYRRTLDSFPSRYMWGGWEKDKEEVRIRVSEYFDTDREEIALIHNTSEGMNLFARSFDLKAGDEIILANHEHRTGVVPYEYYCKPLGVKLVRPVLPLLPKSADEIVDIYRRAISEKTRIISMVHMTNTNGMILPVKEISSIAREKGIILCVDGAQAVGMIKFRISDLGCDYYAASGHKWLFGPKGSGILYASRDKQELLKPLMVSSKWDNINIRMFEDYNTRNLPELLGMGAAFDFNNMIGQDRKQARIYSLKKYFRDQVDGDNRFKIKTPEPDDLSAGIQAVEVKGRVVTEARDYLLSNYNIDCRPMYSHDLNALRISLSVFNTREDIDYLIVALREFADK